MRSSDARKLIRERRPDRLNPWHVATGLVIAIAAAAAVAIVLFIAGVIR